jgi:AcrR family transcriptional regulator
MTANKSTKKKYIEAAHQLMLEDGVGTVSARKVANRLGCAQSSIYKHFQGLDELFLYASIRYLKEYYINVNRIASQSLNALDMYRKTERCFAEFSFKYPVVFNNNLFGIYSDRAEHVMRDFFDMYQDEIPSIDVYTSSILTQGPFSDCNKKLLLGCIEEGSLNIPKDSLDIVNDTLVNLYKGFLKEMLDGTNAVDSAQQTERYLLCFENILQIYQ